jgi:PAS domain-containing protein
LQVHQLELDFQNEELLSSRAELEAACDRQLQLRDASPGAKLVLDEKGCVIEGNALAQQHLHASGPTLVGKALIGWLATADVPRVQAWLTQALARLDAMSLAWTLRVPSHEGREVIAAARANPLAPGVLLAWVNAPAI